MSAAASVKVVLATPSAPFEARVREAMGATNGDLVHWPDKIRLADAPAVVERLIAADPLVVALGPNLPINTLLALTREVDRQRPDVAVLLVTPPKPDLLEEALRAGARDIVAPDADQDELAAAIERALATADRRRGRVQGAGADDRNGKGRVITVASPKGGVGKTVIAVNLALALAQQAPGQVAIVDLDLQFGDVGNALQLQPENTIADAARVPEIDATLLKVFLTPYGTALHALCAPDSPAEAEEVTPEVVASVLDELSRAVPWVVVDTAAGLDEAALAALEASTDIVLVGTTDVPGVRSLRKEIDALDQLGVSGTRHLVLNRANARVGVDVRDIAMTVGQPVDIAVSSSRLVPLSVNQGAPLMESQPSAAVTRELASLAHRLTGAPTAPPTRGGSRLFRRERP